MAKGRVLMQGWWMQLSSELMLPETSYEPLIGFLEDRAVEEDDYHYSILGTLEGWWHDVA